LWIQGNPSWIRGLLPEANSLVSIPSREYRVCFLQASATSWTTIDNMVDAVARHVYVLRMPTYK